MATQCPWDISTCTVDTCSLECAQVHFLPSLPGNAAVAAIFGVLLLCQIFQGIRYRTWGFLVGMTFGLVLELVGYAGRIMLHQNPFNFNNFLIYLIPLTIGPAFIAGSIYLCLARIVVVNGAEVSRISPRTYTIVFILCDFVSLVLQGAGGGLAATGETRDQVNTGRYIMIAGMVFQVVSLTIFMGLWLEFILRLKKAGLRSASGQFARLLAPGSKFKKFSYALWAATIFIFIRSVYRIVELQGGFTGPVASNEPAFMVLEGAMIILAVLALTIFHPGRSFDGAWAVAGWSLRGKKSEDISSGSEVFKNEA